MMKSLLAPPLLALALGAAPLSAQQEGAPDGEERGVEEGLDLLERGAEAFLRGLMDEIGPELRRLEPELRGLAEGMGPMIARLVELVDQIDAYHPPERLPNGDIILRRKTPSEIEDLPPPDEGQIDI
ncbi:hypothetical protein [Rhodovulum sp. 12E13]|uniref:hypothetical protein n=1 Tax=Rhodovulum sp. 12E13 TaxID=2203891 RepID=UPI001F2E89D4|nr:hypothetical protein [Rhodovulum sp. 12E13]